METLRIRKLSARYHLPPSAEAERQRLDRILREMTDGVLETAIERAGVSAGEEVCLRSLYVPVRLRLGGADSALAAAWSSALAEAIRRAADASSPGVVRYTSRMHALVDLAACVAREDYRRAWAWRQLGLWRAGDSPGTAEAVEELLRALLAEPPAIVPVLHALAGREFPPQLLERMASRLTAEDWVRLAQAALEAAGSSGRILGEADPGVAESSRRATRIAEDSPLVRALRLREERGGATAVPVALAEVRRALAALLALEADPAVARAGNRALRTLIASVADALYPAARIAEERRGHVGQQRTDAASAGQPLPESEEEPEIVPVRRRALTGHGGLLFLLHIVDGLIDEILTNPALAARTFRWRLHRLALTLAPAAAEDDPAGLAFAGLRPADASPARNEPPPREEELAALDEYAARIAADLKERLEEPGPAAPLVPLVCGREAEVFADPGWIELHFSLRDVSTAIRRAGLDLDLEYVPWLGVVVRFVYD
jgi:hypothetical protein